jgi:hypothetical protein
MHVHCSLKRSKAGIGIARYKMSERRIANVCFGIEARHPTTHMFVRAVGSAYNARFTTLLFFRTATLAVKSSSAWRIRQYQVF